MRENEIGPSTVAGVLLIVEGGVYNNPTLTTANNSEKIVGIFNLPIKTIYMHEITPCEALRKLIKILLK